jgi:SAM-dependent methyltransferase
MSSGYARHRVGARGESIVNGSEAECSRCIACDAPAGGVVLRGGSAWSEGLVLLRCSRCGHVYLDGWAAEFKVDLYAYYEARVGGSREQVYNPLNTKRQRELLDWLGTRTRARRLLDVGCGEGQLVSTASEAGWDALGIDLATGAIAVAQSFGVKCLEEDFFAPSLDAERFDVITMTELIEHVPSPARFLRRAHDLLDPGGLLYVTTPNFASLARRIMGGAWHPIHPEHLSYFTFDLLRRLAGEAGLELMFGETRNFDPRAALHLVQGAASTIRPRHPSSSRSIQAVDAPPPAGAMPETPLPQRMRALLERSAPLRAAKRAVNAALSAASAGDTMFLTFRR